MGVGHFVQGILMVLRLSEALAGDEGSVEIRRETVLVIEAKGEPTDA